MENKKSKSENKNLTWSFKGMYSSPRDPRIEKDMKNYEALCDSFEKKYKKSVSKFSNPTFIFKALEDFRNILESRKPLFYISLYRAVNAKDDFAQGLEQTLSSRSTNSGNKILFFTNSISKLQNKDQAILLNNSKLSLYKKFLKKLFISGKYSLSDSEEKIINLLSSPAYDIWYEGGSKKRSLEKVKFGGKEIPLAEASGLIRTLPTEKRRSLYIEILKVFERNSDYAENELNAIYTFKKIDDELRGYKTPYESTLISHEVSNKTLNSLLESVKYGFKFSKDFYTLKKNLLGLDYLKYCDRAVSIGQVKRKFTWEESIEILRKSFGEMDNEFQMILDKMIEDGRIDVIPRVGKRGGAFCSHRVNEPTHVMLNHTNDFDSLSTFAHEIGHAIHSEFSKKQSSIYEYYSTAVAETASTFFERVVFDEILNHLDAEDKKIAIHNKIQDDVNTIFRQIAVFMFELDAHESVRRDGFVSKDVFAEKMNKYMSMYLGPSMKLENEDGLFFVDWPHLRYFFYVYSYAFGQIVSNALYEEYKKDKKYINSIKKFLSAGSSMSPEEIFKSIGVDTSKPDFFKKGIDSFAKDLKEFKKIYKK